jgi:hypothetical protein
MKQINARYIVPWGFHYVCRRETRSEAGGIAPIHNLHNTTGKAKGNQHLI